MKSIKKSSRTSESQIGKAKTNTINSKQSSNEGSMIDPDDPLLIAQSLTYITDNGSVLLTFESAPYSFAFKLRLVMMETIFALLLIVAVPINAHGTVVVLSVCNLLVIAWFWYNSVRTVEVTVDGSLRFWIGNIEIDVPFDKIIDMRRISGECSIVSPALQPHRGFLTTPTDGVAIITSVPSTPFFMWPRSAGRPERRLGPFTCPRLKIVFSPCGGSLNFIHEVEKEIRDGTSNSTKAYGHIQQPPAFDVNKADTFSDFLDV